MSWFNNRDKDVPDKLKGKTEAEILADLDAAEKLKAEKATADAAKAAAETALAANNTELEKVKTSLAELEANVRTRGLKDPPARETPVGPTSVLIDEEAAWRERLGPVVVNQMQIQSQLAVNSAIETARQDPTKSYVLKKWRKEIDDKFNTMNLQQKTFAASYTNCINLVLGEHINDIRTAEAKQDPEFAVEGGSTVGTKPPEPARSEKLSDEELEAAKRLKIDPKKYLERRNKMQFVGA